MSQFADVNVEKIVLSFLLKDIKYIDEFLQDGADATCFYTKEAQTLCGFVLKQYKTFHSILSRYTCEFVLLATNVFVKDDDKISLLLFYDQVSAFKQTQLINDNEFQFYFNELKESKLKQQLLAVLSETADQLKAPNKSGKEVLSFVTNKVLTTEAIGRKDVEARRFIYETCPSRKQRYLDKKQFPEKFRGVPFGMSKLDENTNGIQKSFLTTIIGYLAKGKSRFLLNVGYNASFFGYAVLYITIEISAEYVEYLWDSRNTLLGFHGIAYGKLDSLSENMYFEKLDAMVQQQVPFYIVDMPEGCTPANVKNEIVVFRKKYQRDPDLVIIDYGNLMSPNERGYSEAQDQGNVFKELKRLARTEKIGILTAGQQNRDGEKAKEASNLYIALSNKIAENSDTVFFLKRDAVDDINHQIHVYCKKQRYGPEFYTTLYADFGYNYIGDNEIPWSDRQITVITSPTAARTDAPILGDTPSSFFKEREF